MFTESRRRAACVTSILFLIAGSFLLISRLRAQDPAGRIGAEINNSARTQILGSKPPLARRENDAGTVPSQTMIHGAAIAFRRSAAQEANLQALIAAQQNPASHLYHQWLTPEQFAARFGMSDSDLAKVQSWLKAEGFSVDRVARSKNRISFSGTAGQIKEAFGAELHYYNINGERNFAPSSDLSVPSALAPVVQDVSNLSTFRPKPRFRKPKANFTSGETENTFLTPKDIATIYNVNNPTINPAFGSGFTGAGQTIAVVGQTSVSLTDVENFQGALGVPVKDPTLLLVPGTGDVEEFAEGDEVESDLDLEYANGIATGASIIFVYVGDNSNSTVFDAFAYAIDNDIASIISDSYGLCEPGLAPGEYASKNEMLAQGAAQGQSIIVASGDTGSTDCSGVQGAPVAIQEELSVDFPASSQYVTAMGGTEFPLADICEAGLSGTTCPPPPSLWQFTSGTDIISSALAYMPGEGVWNDDALTGGSGGGLSSGGGGISTLTPRPVWQTGVPGISTVGGGSTCGGLPCRLVPDVSLSASNINAPYLLCTSDASGFSQGQVASCDSGFRDAATGALTLAGGTSFDAPIFAGLVALINEKENSVGQGVVSPILYSLASDSTTYANAFHDITSGGNNCSAAGATLCSGSALTQYQAGTGYDLASGLGSLNFDNLITAWPASAASALKASRTTMSPATTPLVTGVEDTITISVTGSGTTPTGSLDIVVDGNTAASPSLNGSGSATFDFTSSTGGSHAITATYSGDSTYAASTATLVVGNQSFRLTATSPAVTSGSSTTSTVTITPQEGYTGSISWSVSSSPAFTNGCFSLPPDATVSNSSAVSATLTINTAPSACSGAVAALMPQRAGSVRAGLSGSSQPRTPSHRGQLGAIVASLLLAGVFVRRPGKLRNTACMMVVLALLAGLPACGGGSSNNQGSGNVAVGNYTVTLVGTDTSNGSISGAVAIGVTVN